MEIPCLEKEYFVSWAEEVLGMKVVPCKMPHGDEGAVYQLDGKNEKYFLKIVTGTDFLHERERLAWFKGKLPVPEVIGFTQKEGTGALLLTAIEGENLKTLSQQWPPDKVIQRIVDALHTFHTTDPTGWPFERFEEGKILVHGDACLPNFIFQNDKLSGYIDLAEAALANVEVDLAAAIWSLQYNLGAGHGVEFLKRYGYKEATEEVAERLRLQYEDYQKINGFLD